MVRPPARPVQSPTQLPLTRTALPHPTARRPGRCRRCRQRWRSCRSRCVVLHFTRVCMRACMRARARTREARGSCCCAGVGGLDLPFSGLFRRQSSCVCRKGCCVGAVQRCTAVHDPHAHRHRPRGLPRCVRIWYLGNATFRCVARAPPPPGGGRGGRQERCGAGRGRQQAKERRGAHQVRGATGARRRAGLHGIMPAPFFGGGGVVQKGCLQGVRTQRCARPRLPPCLFPGAPALAGRSASGPSGGRSW